ncbi:topoisomerase ii-associated [Fusarium sporotrichioides]|uniref:Topoisomerase ii-associated n=1 Tax=Fusarium sporotrichioides TaxID=5514 RepID=A0A395RIE7_FUSSP|nr:topoisomerase ii-associated [Fusarium sporotrichioides]
MAPQNGKPHNGNSKPRRPGGSKLAQSSKPLPAIPLPYVKRQAARANAASTATQKPDAPSPSELKLTNGNASTEVKKAESVASAAAPSLVSSPVSTSAPKAEEESIELKVDGPSKSKSDTTDPVNSHKVSVASVSEHPTTTENEDTHKKPAVSGRADQPTTNSQADIGARTSDKTTAKMDEKPNGVASKGETKPQAGEAPQYRQDYSDAHNPDIDNHHISKMKSRPPPAVPPGRYQLPPAFQPSGRPLGSTANGELRGPRPLMPNGPPLHQPHPSNGSIHFGAFHGSTSSSPAPLSGGIAPPPGMLGPDGRPPYMAPGTNGFPHMMPYAAEPVPVTTFDNFGRPTSMAYGPMDSFPPYGNNFGPSTPHSYLDSQTSGPPDDASVYNQFASAPVRNGVMGSGEDNQSPNYPGRMFGGPEYPQMMQNAGPPPHMMSGMDDVESLINHFQQQFGSPEFADCVLELQFTNRRVLPVRIPGHRILFSRSSELAGAMSKGLSRPSDVTQLPTLVLETESKWIQSDSFYFAVQRLYGLPLFTPPPGLKQGTTTDSGSLTERFDFALGYAASGHLLHWDAVTRRGCELAMELLDVQTVEKALEFALEGHRDEGSYDVFKYGDGSRAMLREIVSFIANNLHPTFKLDTSVTDPSNYARLPAQAALASNATNRKLSPPPIARGTSVHLKGRRSQQISGIQFGDLSSTESVMSPASDASGPSQPQRTSLHAVLSRVLLNLPFETLKALLENATRDGNAWPNADAVFHAVKDTVAERERRRLQIVEMVKNRQIPQWEIVSNQLSIPEPRNYIGPWGALGWQEEIVPFGPSESPTLNRTWTPLTNFQTTTQAAYP